MIGKSGSGFPNRSCTAKLHDPEKWRRLSEQIMPRSSNGWIVFSRCHEFVERLEHLPDVAAALDHAAGVRTSGMSPVSCWSGWTWPRQAPLTAKANSRLPQHRALLQPRF
jgi:hypothetical protein